MKLLLITAVFVRIVVRQWNISSAWHLWKPIFSLSGVVFLVPGMVLIMIAWIDSCSKDEIMELAPIAIMPCDVFGEK